MTTIAHGQTIKRQRLIWRLLDRLDSLSFIARLKWLRALRFLVIVVALGCFAQGWHFFVLLALVSWIAIEIMLFRVAVVEMIKELDR